MKPDEIITMAEELLGEGAAVQLLQRSQDLQPFAGWLESLGRLDSLRDAAPHLVSRLVAKARRERKTSNLLDMGAEFQVASWLIETGALIDEAPGVAREPVLDFSVACGGSVVGVDAKHDRTGIDDWLMYGDGPNDQLALYPALTRAFGSGIAATIGFQRPPSRDEIGPLRPTLLRQLESRLLALGRLPENQPARITVTIGNSARVTQRVHINVSRSFSISTSIVRRGEGWGTVVERVVAEAQKKASKTSQPFILAYSSRSRDTQFVDPHRLAYAAQEIEERAPEQLVGVVTLSNGGESGSTPARPSAAGWFRSGWEGVRDTLSVDELPTLDHRLPASAVWDLVRKAIDDGVVRSAGFPSHDTWLQLADRAARLTCADQAAQDVLVQTVLMASNAEPLFRPGVLLGEHWWTPTSTFPAAPDALLAPHIPTPPR